MIDCSGLIASWVSDVVGPADDEVSMGKERYGETIEMK